MLTPVQYKIQLVQLEDDLLERLANAPDDILSDVPLIEGLEATKVRHGSALVVGINMDAWRLQPHTSRSTGARFVILVSGRISRG